MRYEPLSARRTDGWKTRTREGAPGDPGASATCRGPMTVQVDVVGAGVAWVPTGAESMGETASPRSSPQTSAAVIRTGRAILPNPDGDIGASLGCAWMLTGAQEAYRRPLDTWSLMPGVLFGESPGGNRGRGREKEWISATTSEARAPVVVLAVFRPLQGHLHPGRDQNSSRGRPRFTSHFQAVRDQNR